MLTFNSMKSMNKSGAQIFVKFANGNHLMAVIRGKTLNEISSDVEKNKAQSGSGVKGRGVKGVAVTEARLACECK